MALKPAIVRKRMWDNPWESRHCWKVVPGSLVRTEIIGPLFLSYRRKRMSLLIHVSGSTYYSRPFEWYWGFRGSLKVIHICGETSDPLTFLGWKSGGTNRSTGFRVSTRANGLSLHSNLRNFNFDIPTVATNVAPSIPAGLIGLIIFGSAYHPKKNTAPQPQSQLFQRHIHQLPRAAGTDAVADRARQRGLWPGWEICLICVAQWPCGLIWHMWINSIYMAMQSL